MEEAKALKQSQGADRGGRGGPRPSQYLDWWKLCTSLCEPRLGLGVRSLLLWWSQVAIRFSSKPFKGARRLLEGLEKSILMIFFTHVNPLKFDCLPPPWAYYSRYSIKSGWPQPLSAPHLFPACFFLLKMQNPLFTNATTLFISWHCKTTGSLKLTWVCWLEFSLKTLMPFKAVQKNWKLKQIQFLPFG